MTTKKAKEITTTPPMKKQSYSSPIAITAVITLIALGASLFATQRTYRLQQENQTLKSKLLTLEQKQNLVDDDTASLTKSINTNQENIKTQVNTLEQQLQNTLHQPLYQTNDWMLLKVRYYLELAQINAQWSDNNETTQSLLKQADALLKNIHDQRLYKIRQAIASELTQLEAVQTPDIVNMLSQLDALFDAVDTLNFRSPVHIIHPKNPEEPQSASGSAWRDTFNQSIAFLKTLVVVRRQKEDFQPLPSPSDETIIRERIQLKLQEAQWAILEHNESVYQWALAEAIKNIKRSFAINDTKTKTALTQLETLQKNHLIRVKHLLNQSLPLLNQLIESNTQQMNQTTEKSS